RCYPNPGIHPDLLPFDWEREQPLLRERAERMQPNRYASCANHAQIEELTAVQTDAPLGAWHRVIGRMFSMAPARSVYDDAPDALAFVHQVEPLVDVRQWHGVSDHRVDLDLSLHVPVDDFRHVGAAARPAECRSFPNPAGDQLERSGRNFCAGRRNADDDGLAPVAMAC